MIELEFRNVGRKTGEPGEKTLDARERINIEKARWKTNRKNSKHGFENQESKVTTQDK
jgi:hypothetical protein